MVPKHGELELCEAGKTRLLMASDGLYLETRTPWGHLVEKLWNSPRPLPYGEVEEVDTFEEAAREAMDAIEEMKLDAADYAERDLEWAGWVVYGPKGFRYERVKFAATAVSARVTHPKLVNGESLAIDVHSHGTMLAGFSSTDNEDDKGGVRICITLGEFNHDSVGGWKASCRYVVEGFFFERGYGQI
jgi:PRTRC genetic system protein A